MALYTGAIRGAETWFTAQGWTLGRADAAQVAAYLATKPVTWASRNLLRAALRHYWTITEHPRPPLAAVRVPPKPAMVCHALDEGDARILAKAARARGDRMGLATLLGLYAALRREEIATLRWENVQPNGWVEITGKGSKRRTIPLHPVLVEALAELGGGPTGYIFQGRLGGHVTPATVWEWVHKVSAEAGVADVWTHRLRHSGLATANDNTGDLRSVQAFAGHSRPETTAGYTRASAKRLQAVVNSLDY